MRIKSQSSLCNPELMISKCLLDKQAKVEAWLRMQWQQTPPPFYSSVDLRNSGFKLAPVDTNLFSAGFNNLNPNSLPLCIQAIQDAIGRVCLSARKVLLIPEDHTRNIHYLNNLTTLCEIIQHAGLEVRIGSISAKQTTVIELPFKDSAGVNRSVKLEPLIVEKQHLMVEDFVPCVCLMNNDLSAGVPEILLQAKQSMFVPPLELGWSERLKTNHFTHYKNVAAEFAEHLKFDPWFVDPLFGKCDDVNFSMPDDDDCLAKNVRELLIKIQAKYDQYKIDKKPFVLVKSDTGTYGMGIMVVHSADEIIKLNRKQRKRMSTNKGGKQINKVILQEGVYTFDTTDDNHVCEPVVYMFDKDVVGGFYRVHAGRGENENLNSPGMHFEPLTFTHSLIMPNRNQPPDEISNKFYAYGVVARLAMLAAAREIAEVIK